MKTKIKIFMIVFVIAAMKTTSSQAQIYYYQNDGSYALDEQIWYNCDIEFDFLVTLYNSKNIYTYKKNTYSDDSEYFPRNHGPSYSLSAESEMDINNRVNKTLTDEQKQLIGEWSLTINIIIEPLTGKIIEVFFRLNKLSPFNLLSPTVFRQIELNFLEYPVINGLALTDLGRKLNYVKLTWVHDFH